MNKALIDNWLSGFVQLMCQLSDDNFKFNIECGNGILQVPDDLLPVLKRLKLAEYNVIESKYFIIYKCQSGDSVLTIQPSKTLQKGLLLSIKNDETRKDRVQQKAAI